mgnify:CR=1 FL=1
MTGSDHFQRETNVSRETLAKLEQYAALLQKWNPAINLVARSTLDDIWSRHMLDSAQILSLAPEDVMSWADLGAGGGFPGLVVATMAQETHPALHVTLVESDQRKATFLRTVARELGLNVSVLSQRVESIEDLKVQVVSARALAALDPLLALAKPLLQADGICIFPQGATCDKEVQEALASWSFVAENFVSKTDSNATILKLREIRRV